LPVFLDTGAIYSLADRNDADHGEIRTIYLNPAHRFVTHELVLIETFSLVTKRLHKHAALEIVGSLRKSPRVQILPIFSGLLEAAWERCKVSGSQSAY